MKRRDRGPGDPEVERPSCASVCSPARAPRSALAIRTTRMSRARISSSRRSPPTAPARESTGPWLRVLHPAVELDGHRRPPRTMRRQRRPADPPAWISTWSWGVGSPAPTIRSRPRVSSGDSARRRPARRAPGSGRRPPVGLRRLRPRLVCPSSVPRVRRRPGDDRVLERPFPGAVDDVRAADVSRRGPTHHASPRQSGAQPMGYPRPLRHRSGSVSRMPASSPGRTGRAQQPRRRPVADHGAWSAEGEQEGGSRPRAVVRPGRRAGRRSL